MSKRYNPTLREVIEELKQFPEEMMDEEIISIGTLSGDVLYRYSITTVDEQGSNKHHKEFGKTLR